MFISSVLPEIVQDFDSVFHTELSGEKCYRVPFSLHLLNKPRSRFSRLKNWNYEHKLHRQQLFLANKKFLGRKFGPNQNCQVWPDKISWPVLSWRPRRCLRWRWTWPRPRRSPPNTDQYYRSIPLRAATCNNKWRKRRIAKLLYFYCTTRGHGKLCFSR